MNGKLRPWKSEAFCHSVSTVQCFKKSLNATAYPQHGEEEGDEEQEGPMTHATAGRH